MPIPLETKSKAPRVTMFLTWPKRKVLITAFGVIIFFSIFLVNFIQGMFLVVRLLVVK